MNNLGQLSAEIIPSIIQHVAERDLYSCTLINKHFYTITSPLLWRSIHVSDNKTNGTTTTLSQRFLDGLIVAARSSVGQYVQHVQIEGRFWTDTTLLVLLERIPRLVSLHIGVKTRITDHSVQQLGRHCRQLTGLSLHRVPVTQLSMDALGQHCRHLRHLSLDACHALGSNTFAALKHCPLEHLSIRSPSPWMLSEPGIMDVMQCHARLTHLALPGSPMAFIERLLLLLSTHPLPHLACLTISHYKGTHDDPGALVPFLQTHTGLKELGLCFGVFSDITLDGMAALERFQLTHLRLDGTRSVSVPAIRRLIQHCPRLRYVSLAMCSRTEFEFPEASQRCLTTRTFAYPHHGDVHHVDHLDQDAITKIRLNS
ncbi:unnamed protein product [Absidia cylindrospora]